MLFVFQNQHKTFEVALLYLPLRKKLAFFYSFSVFFKRFYKNQCHITSPASICVFWPIRCEIKVASIKLIILSPKSLFSPNEGTQDPMVEEKHVCMCYGSNPLLSSFCAYAHILTIARLAFAQIARSRSASSALAESCDSFLSVFPFDCRPRV